MSANDNLSRLQNIVGYNLGLEPDSINPEDHFENDLGADSLDVVELVMAIEYDYDIEIEDSIASNIETIQDALNYLEGRWDWGDDEY